MKKTIILMGATLFLAACGSESEPETPTEPETTQEAAPEREARREIRRNSEQPSEPPQIDRSEDPAKDIPRISGQAEEAGYGLTMIVDGSSPKAFQESLEIIASDSTDEQYRSLDSALRYMEMYSPESWEGNAALYESLDGMSGEEIIKRAQELREKRQR